MDEIGRINIMDPDQHKRSGDHNNRQGSAEKDPHLPNHTATNQTQNSYVELIHQIAAINEYLYLQKCVLKIKLIEDHETQFQLVDGSNDQLVKNLKPKEIERMAQNLLKGQLHLINRDI